MKFLDYFRKKDTEKPVEAVRPSEGMMLHACPKCNRLFEDKIISNEFNLDIPSATCTKCGYRIEYPILTIYAENYGSYTIRYDRKNMRLFTYSEWAGSVDDAATYTEENDISVDEACGHIRRKAPDDPKSLEALKFLEMLKSQGLAD